MPMGKYQGRFPTHAVADDARALDVAFIEVVKQVFCHRFIGVLGVVRAPAVVALIDEVHAVGFGKSLAQGLPIVRGAEQAVQDDEVWCVVLAQFPAEEFESIGRHGLGMSKQAK
jgi:hypothetical protein